jgi:hypothetical protein
VEVCASSSSLKVLYELLRRGTVGKFPHLVEGYGLEFQGFRVSGFQGFRVSGFQGFRVSGFQGFRVSGFQGFRVSGFQS